jgi:hypothetical protein
MKLAHSRRSLALALLAIVPAVAAVPPTVAFESARFSGRVVGADGLTPRAGAVVALFAEGDEAGLRQQTGADGSFTIEDARAGSYRLLVQAEEGAYLFHEPLSLKPGANTPLALRLQAQPGMQTTATTGTTTTTEHSFPTWVKWVIVGVIGAAALFVINDVSEDEDEAPSSPF